MYLPRVDKVTKEMSSVYVQYYAVNSVETVCEAIVVRSCSLECVALIGIVCSHC